MVHTTWWQWERYDSLLVTSVCGWTHMISHNTAQQCADRSACSTQQFTQFQYWHLRGMQPLSQVLQVDSVKRPRLVPSYIRTFSVKTNTPRKLKMRIRIALSKQDPHRRLLCLIAFQNGSTVLKWWLCTVKEGDRLVSMRSNSIITWVPRILMLMDVFFGKKCCNDRFFIIYHTGKDMKNVDGKKMNTFS